MGRILLLSQTSARTMPLIYDALVKSWNCSLSRSRTGRDGECIRRGVVKSIYRKWGLERGNFAGLTMSQEIK